MFIFILKGQPLFSECLSVTGIPLQKYSRFWWNQKAGDWRQEFSTKVTKEKVSSNLPSKDSDEVFKPVSEKTRCLEACYSELQLNERKEGDVTGKEVKTGFSKNETETMEDDTEIETYDSTIEHIFSNLSLGSWKIKREPTILKAGKYAFVPDFSLERDAWRYTWK